MAVARHHPTEPFPRKQDQPQSVEVDSELSALRKENKELRELVVQLSKIILRKVVDQR